MSEIERAVEARIAAYRPAATPPFDGLPRRRRRRLVATGAGVGTAALVAAVTVAAVTATPTPVRQDGPGPSAMVRPGGPGPTAAPAPLTDRAAYDRWRAKGGPDYTMRFTRACFCPRLGPVTVTVVGGRVVSPGGRDRADVRTIEQLFTLIRSGEADRIEVTYDPEYGYPRAIDADMILNAVDDEVRYRVTDYRPLPPP